MRAITGNVQGIASKLAPTTADEWLRGCLLDSRVSGGPRRGMTVWRWGFVPVVPANAGTQ
ncbi:hypothetical protein PSEWESI4_00827 [Pseudomonas carbonaria]|uniref:Uncharacterized protein n=1 Tax=Zestomonas carbonaria TaxID=2762745 RepID=A0A7U7EK84_9GAMM|nr:hypothetical protein PSEWESI4_00827 [Pseudomonas carbonaria]